MAVNRCIQNIERTARGSKLHIQINDIVKFSLQSRKCLRIIFQMIKRQILFGQKILQFRFKLFGEGNGMSRRLVVISFDAVCIRGKLCIQHIHDLGTSGVHDTEQVQKQQDQQ